MKLSARAVLGFAGVVPSGHRDRDRRLLRGWFSDEKIARVMALGLAVTGAL